MKLNLEGFKNLQGLRYYKNQEQENDHEKYIVDTLC